MGVGIFELKLYWGLVFLSLNCIGVGISEVKTVLGVGISEVKTVLGLVFLRLNCIECRYF